MMEVVNTDSARVEHGSEILEGRVYSVAELSDLLGVTRPTIYDWIKNSGLIAPTVNGKAKGKRFVTGKNLIKFLEGR
tara:strand:- start:291 stop:521 length:231 start_codon:yes stop_codon:yes gene_type:complete